MAPEVRAGVGATEAKRGDAQVLTVAAWGPIGTPKKDGFEYQIPLFPESMASIFFEGLYNINHFEASKSGDNPK